MKIQVVPTKFKKLSDRYIPLVIVNGTVDMTAASFLMQRFDAGHPTKTIRAEADAIKKLYEFCAQRKFSLSQRFAASDHLTVGEIEALSAFYSARIDTGEVVAPPTFKIRWLTTTAFVKFIWTFYQQRLKDPTQIKTAQTCLEAMKESFKLHGKAPYNAGGADKIGLNEELKVKFLAIINPLDDNELNPWKSEYIRWRNFCLFLTMILSGNRKGESLGLKLRDFNLAGPTHSFKYFEIRKDKHEGYVRKERPSAKTRERKVPLNPVMVDIFTHYITKVRPILKGAKRSEYLFLSRIDHNPISVQTPNDALNVLIKKYPEFEGHLTPHRLRNTYFDDLRDLIDAKHEAEGPISKKAIRSQLMEYAGGWAKGSEMPDHYAKGSIQRSVSKFVMELQGQVLDGNSKEGESVDE